MSNVFELEASLGIDTSKYKKGIKEAIEEAEKLRDELNKTGKETKETGREIDKEGEEAEDSAKSNKKLGEEIKRAGSNAEESKSKFAALGGAIKDGLATVAKIGIAATGAAATGVATLVKQSISAYAEYEQLTGGIETLFGDSANKVIANSEKAFATAGMSVNEYMETSIQGAAALINSLGGDTAQAAELIDVSIQDMSDNVNKMGTSMESIQNAYRGFSRQNFTMLDNLSLGFAGTKEGMQQLLDKARELSGVEYDINSYADIVKAIHVVQTEMGITGTTAKEAAGTITGSIASVKAAWKNLTIEMAKENGDVGGAFKVLGDNVGAVVENMLPKVENALAGVGELITAAAPQISKAISTLIPKLVPSLLKSGASLVSSVAKGLVQSAPELFSATTSIMKELFSGFMGVDLGPFEWIKDDAVKIIDVVKRTFNDIDLEGLKDKFANIGTAVGGILERVGDGATWLVDNAVAPLIEWAANSNFLDGIAAGFQLIGDAVDFMKTPAKAVWEEFLKPILSTAADVWDVAAGGLKKIADSLEGIDWEGYWIDMFDGHFGEDWKLGWQAIYDAFAQGGEAIDDFFSVNKYAQGWNEFWQGVGEHVFNIKTGIVNAMKEIEDAMARVFGDPEEEAKAEYDVGATIKDDKGRDIILYDENGNRTAGYNAYIRQQAKKDYEIWKNFDIDEYRKANGIPAYAEGGRVTRPTIALIGEKEPETVVPDSKLNSIGSTTNYITINVEGYSIKNDEEFTELLSRKLSELSVRQQRALGGAGW